MAATVAASEPRIEIVGERRRAHDASFRARVVERSLVPGTRVQDLARRHGICKSLIYRWRRQVGPRAAAAAPPSGVAPGRSRSTEAPDVTAPLGFVPIGTLGRPAPPPGAPWDRHRVAPRPAAEGRPGAIEIDSPDGTRLRVDAFVNERALRRVLAVPKAAS